MRTADPGSPGFNITNYLGKMLRVGIKITANVGQGGPFAGLVGDRFPLAEPHWVSTVSGWIESGKNALMRFLKIGQATPEVISLTPIVPASAFQIDPGDRLIIVGDMISQNQVGEIMDRKATSHGFSENEFMEDVFGRAVWDLLNKIRSTNPDEYNEMFTRLFQASWMGRAF